MSESASLADSFVELADPSARRNVRLRLPGLLKDFVLSINVLLVFVPLGFVSVALRWHDVIVAAFNFLAIIPLSWLISDASDTIGTHLGDLVGGLVNATFGNTVELIVGIIAIYHDELLVAQSMMLGSILSDILLVQGCCIVIAARTKGVICVNSSMVDSLSSLMLLAAMALALPTALYATLPDAAGRIDIDKKILSFSRATVVVLLVVYTAYLYFQLKTHSSLFTGHADDVDEHRPVDGRRERPTTDSPAQQIGEAHPGEGEQDDVPSMGVVYKAGAVLVISSLLIGRCTHSFMESLNGMTKALGITKTFVALFILPVASNAPELSQVVAASRKQKVDFAVGVIIGSILQIALFVLPILVVTGWAMGRPLDLYFEVSQTYILLFAVVLVNQVLHDRQYTYLHGVMLLCVYAVITMAYFTQSNS
ncbi:sodium/calcium exchanger protein [Hirsutella rhossiliensis]|uniref:Vacuolar calcium ion transporter n=1 Tax=Hirsutella rhossiliensis TaxID=111463 RepID=A0A9P8NB27_9HYPO|nr:sodium/calcium exchanger protein [Hirsutella rhossiliensis]KAH0967887.1 sodium/calcium exchanger protein [Hirsutella rhossiliensis]